MSHSAVDLINHILSETQFLKSRLKDLSEDTFMFDEVIQRAFVRSLEIIGEASNKIPSDIKDNNPGINWKSLAGMRNKLIHEYFGIDYELIWDVVNNKIPELDEFLNKLITKLK
jgi:uncharacterized protein with HEPN domain